MTAWKESESKSAGGPKATEEANGAPLEAAADTDKTPQRSVTFSAVRIVGDPSSEGRLRTAQAARAFSKEDHDSASARHYLDETLHIQSEMIRSGNRFTTKTLGGVSAVMLGPIAVGQVAAALAGPTSTIWSLGRLADTEVASDYLKYSRLSLPGWLWRPWVNDLWLKWAISRGATFYLASEITKQTLDASDKPWLITVFARELTMLDAAGYTKIGQFLVPP